jgi:FKBP-type peptidyl-prolyl cis-trans isomerase
MNRRRSRTAPALSFALESLEGRVVLSAIGTALPQGSVEVAAQVLKNASTVSTLAVHAGTLGQPITFTATVRAPASAGSPTGTVSITDHGNVIAKLTLSPTTSTNSKYAYSSGTYTLTQQPGGSAFYFGKYTVSATLIPGGGFSKSSVSKTFTVSKPAYTDLANGVKIETIAPGSGPQIQAGQTASVMYTGYLASNGQIFDDSINDGGAPFSFTVGAGEVVPGFDAGTAGMQVGETRIVEIPASQGYGSESNGAIPPNSTLIFVLTLESIS